MDHYGEEDNQQATHTQHASPQPLINTPPPGAHARAHRPAVVAQAGDQHSQHARHLRRHRPARHLGRQLAHARTRRLAHRVVVGARAAHVVVQHLHAMATCEVWGPTVLPHKACSCTALTQLACCALRAGINLVVDFVAWSNDRSSTLQGVPGCDKDRKALTGLLACLLRGSGLRAAYCRLW